MNARHDPVRLSLGAYALGTLEPGEAHDVEAHLATCPACLAELDELITVVPVLASTSADDLASPEPSGDLFERIAGAVTETPARRSRQRWSVAVAASVLVLAGAGTAIGFAVSSSSSSPSPATTHVSASAGRLQLSVAASDASTGTRLVLAVRGLPRHERCHLVATAADGSRHDAGTWDASYDGEAKVVEATDVARSQLRRLTLYGNGGRRLVAVDL